ncbi:MAG: ABC transporter permease [Epsilonproteobacteria bacterium]|nr:ABC transporter permease [Campylobacterota bacterium]
MHILWLVARLDIKESIRAKWFYIYSFVFGGLIALFFLTGVTQSVVMGFSGLSRLLLVYIQVTIVILPIFILITTVRSISGDRESHILEYMLSFPVSLKSYYWGKLLGRFVTVFFPVFVAMIIGVIWGLVKGSAVPWEMLILYSAMLFALTWVFLGIAFFISTLVKSQDIALGSAFFVWIVLLAFIDIVLIGMMMQSNVDERIIIFSALINPLETFRIGAISLFDPELTVIGPTAYYILDLFGKNMFMVFSIVYPVVVGTLFSLLGYKLFTKRDLL